MFRRQSTFFTSQIKKTGETEFGKSGKGKKWQKKSRVKGSGQGGKKFFLKNWEQRGRSVKSLWEMVTTKGWSDNGATNERHN